jgi:glucose-1-phosphate cytidylyltransferase
MKVVILAGGLGTRMAEETEVKPKPMVEIGGQPIIWHIMMHYSCYGFNHFVLALGYKGDVIKKYILDQVALSGSIRVKLRDGEVKMHEGNPPDWTVDLVETGFGTMTGGRVKRLAPYLGNTTFMMTYGDGVSNVNLQKLLDFHRSHGKLATLTATHPIARFGRIDFDEKGQVGSVSRSPQTPEGWINGGFFVLELGVLDYIDGDMTFWEKEPLEGLARDGQLMAYRHDDFWQCMDTSRDKVLLENLWQSGNPPWRIWESTTPR